LYSPTGGTSGHTGSGSPPTVFSGSFIASCAARSAIQAAMAASYAAVCANARACSRLRVASETPFVFFSSSSTTA
jgi:hypothetical protein